MRKVSLTLNNTIILHKFQDVKVESSQVDKISDYYASNIVPSQPTIHLTINENFDPITAIG